MIIFFDWDHDGNSDHVGIVEKCEGGRVYTVEGKDVYKRQEPDSCDRETVAAYERCHPDL